MKMEPRRVNTISHQCRKDCNARGPSVFASFRHVVVSKIRPTLDVVVARKGKITLDSMDVTRDLRFVVEVCDGQMQREMRMDMR
jgi:hypothetical protein